MKEMIEMIKYGVGNNFMSYGLGVCIFFLMFFVKLTFQYLEKIYDSAEKINSRKIRLLKSMIIEPLTNPLQKTCIENEVRRIKNKQLCGCDDIALQQYILVLSDKYADLVSASFFYKVRSAFDLRRIRPTINVTKILVIGWWIERAFFFQFLLLAFFYVLMAIFLADTFTWKQQAVLYLMSSILLFIYPLMIKNTPTLREVRLMKEIQRRETLNHG